jgi:hypothetical protein
MPSIECRPPTNSPLSERKDQLALHGPHIPINIGLDQGYDEALPERVPQLQAKGLPALIDTGAVTNYIDETLAKQLGLPEINKQTVVPAHGGPKEIKSYLGQIYIPAAAYTIFGEFGGLDLVASGHQCYAVLGREFLMGFRMDYDGRTGIVTLSW